MKFLAKHNGREIGRKSGMNKTETAYAGHLKLRLLAGEIIRFDFEAVKFRLADNTFYTPDFVVYSADGFVELHEVKGHWEDDARVKIKVVASLFPFRVIAIQKVGTGWKFEEFTHT